MNGRDELAAKKGVTTDERVTTVRCLRCNARWSPTMKLRRRPVGTTRNFYGGFGVPAGWWRCPNLCNGRGTADHDSASEFSSDTATTTPAKTSTTPVVSDDEEIIPRREGSGEVLTFADLEEAT